MNWTLLALTAGAALAAASSASAQVRGEVTPLGVGAQSGAMCEAVRNYDDPIGQRPHTSVWAVRCRGWDAPIGRLYALPDATAAGLWTQALAARATCKPEIAQPLAGLTEVRRRSCSLAGSTAPYVAYVGRRGRVTLAAQGYAAGADVLETGLKVMSGAAPAPKALDVQMSQASAEIAADFGGSVGGLAGAENAAATDTNRLLARGYVQNNEWRFDQAETDFRALVAATQAQDAPPRERAEALLNLALNVSNSGRFAEADDLFEQADEQVAAAQDNVLRAEALNYRALHMRNQHRFAEAVSMAQGALKIRAEARQEQGGAATPALTSGEGGQLVITPDLAAALNVRTTGGDLMGGDAIPPAKRLMIQDIEALEVIGSSKAAEGDLAGAGQALDSALGLLTVAESEGALSVRLRARILADQGDLDLDQHKPDAAVRRYTLALQVLRTRHAGTSTEAGMLLDLGRAQIAAGQQDAALQTYGRAFDLFKTARGSLGGSADAAQPYFDLLLSRIASHPDETNQDADRFFRAAENVVSDATASTVARLAARVASGDDATAGLVRAVDDTRRRISIVESRIASLQAQNAYKGDARADADGELKALQSQISVAEAELLTANPRYDQLVVSDATLSTLQAALKPDEVYIKTVLLDGRGYGLLVSRTSAAPYAIGLSHDQATQAARALRAPFEAENVLPAFDVAASHALFEQLFGPVKAQLLSARHLVYEPDATLVSVPAALFVTDQASVDLMRTRPGGDDYRNVAWLGQRVDSSLVLSASSFLQSRAFKPSHASQVYLGFGDPLLSPNDPHAFASVLKRSGVMMDSPKVCGATREALLQLPSLPDTAGEVKSVGASLGAPADAVVLGAQFNDGDLRNRKDLSDYRVLYFATHALLPMPEACLPEPALVTSTDGLNSDGLLNTSDILNLKLDADLVVLSACDTGGAGSKNASQTGLQGGGGALGGLTRAVIYAGARDLIVSHWSVDSAATVRLMTTMFRSGAPSAAAGLQQAQAQMQDDPRWSHPYYWAPFTIVGDGSRAIPAATR